MLLLTWLARRAPDNPTAESADFLANVKACDLSGDAGGAVEVVELVGAVCGVPVGWGGHAVQRGACTMGMLRPMLGRANSGLLRIHS